MSRTFFILLLTGILMLFHPAVKSQFLSGYSQPLQGETIRYESQQPDATQALLVRSEEQRKYIEWLTDSIPVTGEGEMTEFIMIAGIDVNPGDNHGFNMYINDESYFSFRNPLDTLNMDWDLKGQNGVSLRLKGMMIDKYGDLFGYLFLSVPHGVFPPGQPLRIRIEGESAGSRSWFMVFKYKAVQQVKFIQEKALLREGDSEKQLIRIDILHFDEPAMAAVQVGKSKQIFPLELGFNMTRIPIPIVTEPDSVEVSVRLNDREIAHEKLRIMPVKKRTIYLLPHSHNDIGYTHVQEEVEAIQWQNIRDAVSFSQKTRDYPAGSQFKWNGEVMWAIDSYLRQCTPEEKDAFRQAVQHGWFELDGLYANILTGLCRPEELYRMMESAVRTSEEMEVPLQAAMITDIPGYTWSLVPVMAQCGIRYFSIGTNTFHRIGDIIETWGDRPFYWQAPSGKEKILCWVHGKGYSEFHTGLAYTRLRNKLKEQLIFDYISELEAGNYPYDIVTMRYNIGSDNGPPDPYLSDIVRSWNEKYSSPRLVISTVSEAFGLFEERYGKTLPVVQGDLTGYWEDGAGSSALQTAMNRASAEQLTQAATLYGIYRPGQFPAELFDQAWRNVLLYSEHTWGSWNSISEPHSPFTQQQWKTKKSFAEEAHGIADHLTNKILQPSMAETATQVDVYNTSSWIRTDLVTIGAEHFTAGDLIRDEEGNFLPSQRLVTGELVFVAEDIPPYSSKRYYFEKSGGKKPTGDETDEIFFPYNHVNLELNEKLGTISSLKFSKFPDELVGDPLAGLNQYQYVEGRNPVNVHGAGPSTIMLKDEGPVLKTIRIESPAPGNESLVREITLYKRIDRIDIKNILDKKDILEPEGVHFVFPFRVPEGVITMSNAWSHYQTETGQMQGANRNYFTANRWADISNKYMGVTFVPVDAPLLEVGGITCDPIEYGWIDTLAPSQTLVSYVMNNYWETNYLASQPGKAVFRYSIFPHEKFDPLQAEKWGMEKHQPLIPVITDSFMPKMAGEFKTLETDEVIVEAILPSDGGLIIRVYNPRADKIVLKLNREGGKKDIYLCDPFGRNRVLVEDELEIAGRDIVHLFTKDN